MGSFQELGEHGWAKMGRGARQTEARVEQDCPTSSPCGPQVLEGLCHKHLITLYQSMGTKTGFYPLLES